MCLTGIVYLSAADSLGVHPAPINTCGDPIKGPRKDAYDDLPLSWLSLCPRCTRLGTGECWVLQEEANAILAEKNYHTRNIGADGSGIPPLLAARSIIAERG